MARMIVAALLALLPLSCSSTTGNESLPDSGPPAGPDAGCTLAAPELQLSLCAAGVQRLESVTATGACTTTGGNLRVELISEGTCHVELLFDGQTLWTTESTVRRDTTCDVLYPEDGVYSVTVPFVACLGDAGFASLVPAHDGVAASLLRAEQAGVDTSHAGWNQLHFFPGGANRCAHLGSGVDAGTPSFAIAVSFLYQGPGDYAAEDPHPFCTSPDGGIPPPCHPFSAQATLSVDGAAPLAGTGLVRLTPSGSQWQTEDLGEVDLLFRDGARAYRLVGDFSGSYCSIE